MKIIRVKFRYDFLIPEHTIKLVEKYKDWFIEQGNISSNEQLRRKGENQVEEMKGSFRKLEVDWPLQQSIFFFLFFS